MEQNVQKTWNEWYWTVIAKTAIVKIISVCKTTDKYFEITIEKEEDLPKLLKYLTIWEKENSMIKNNIKTELEIIRSINNYEQIIAA